MTAVTSDLGSAADRTAAATRTLLVDRVTVEVVGALQDARVESIVLKGPTFSALLYPHGGRLYGDTDLLVAPHDVERAARVLAGLGFVAPSAGLARSEHGSALEFIRASRRRGRELVDLHWAIDPGHDAAHAWRVLWTETEPMPVGPVIVTALNVSGRALHVALHAAHHGLLGPEPDERGGQTGEDLRRALALLGEDVWRDAVDLARAIGSEDALALGLRMTTDGAALADRMGLTTVEPDLWRFAGAGTVPRGAKRLDRVRAATGLGAKAGVLARGAIPSPAHARLKARSRLGRRWLVVAYGEYWWVAVTRLVGGARYVRRRNPPR